MTVQIPEHLERFLREAVERGRFASIDQAVTAAVGMLELKISQQDRQERLPLPPDYKPIWEVAQEIVADVPPDEWAKVPTGSSEQLDDSTGGTPRRPLAP